MVGQYNQTSTAYQLGSNKENLKELQTVKLCVTYYRCHESILKKQKLPLKDGQVNLIVRVLKLGLRPW